MRLLSFVFSVLLLVFIPSVMVYTFFDVYIHLHPFYINIITGCLLFLLGGILVAYGNNRGDQEDKNDGGTT